MFVCVFSAFPPIFRVLVRDSRDESFSMRVFVLLFPGRKADEPSKIECFLADPLLAGRSYPVGLGDRGGRTHCVPWTTGQITYLPDEMKEEGRRAKVPLDNLLRRIQIISFRSELIQSFGPPLDLLDALAWRIPHCLSPFAPVDRCPYLGDKSEPWPRTSTLGVPAGWPFPKDIYPGKGEPHQGEGEQATFG